MCQSGAGAEPRREGSEVPKKFLLLAVLILSAAFARASEDLVLPDVNAPDAFEGAKDNVQGTWWNLLWTDELTHPVLSADGSSVACAMRKGSKWAVMKDGKVYGSEYDSIGRIVLSADGKSIAFQGQKGRRFHIVWNGRESTGYTSCTDPAFSPVDGELAFLAEVEGKKVLFRNGRSAYRKGYDSVGDPVYGPRGNIAYRAHYGGRDFIVRDGVRVGGLYESVTDPLFSRGGAIYFGARNENALVMTREGTVVGFPVKFARESVNHRFLVVKISPVSESVAYTVRPDLRQNEGRRLYLDGRLVGNERISVNDFTFVGDIIYSVAQDPQGQFFVARDGVPVTKAYPSIHQTPSVNAAGRVAFAALGLNRKFAVLVADKQIGKEHEDIKSVFLTDDDSVYYFAKTEKGWTLMRNDAEVEAEVEYSFVTDFVRTGTRSIVFAATSGKEIIRKEINW